MMLGMDMMGGGRRLPRNGLLLYLARPNSDEYLVGEDTEVGEDTYIWGYVLPDDADIREATGWASGTANVFYTATGTPIVALATEIAAAIDHLPLEVVFSLVSETTQTGRLAIYAPGTSDTILARAYAVLRYELALPSSGLLLNTGTAPETIGATTVLRSTLPAGANPTVPQVKGSGFAGAGSATVTGLLTTDTITATGDAPTCTVNGVLTFPGPDCWDVYVHRGGVLWAYWPGINVGNMTELDASGGGHHLTALTTTTITERVDGSGTNYKNVNGFASCIAPPVGFTWPAALPRINIHVDDDGVASTPGFDISAGRPTGKAYYVKYPGGSDLNDGLTWETAFESIFKGVTRDDAGVVYVAAGTYPRGKSWQAQPPVRDISVIAVGGTVVSTYHDNLTWAPDGTYQSVSKATRSTIYQVRDMSILDENGYAELLTARASVEEVSLNPGSYYTDNVSIWVLPSDSRPADSDIFCPMIGGNGRTTDTSIYVEGFEFLGGNPFRALNSQSVYTSARFKNCIFKYGYRSNSGGFSSVGAVVSIFENCVSECNEYDGFNYHINGSYIPVSVEINCIGRNNGTYGTSETHNGSSMHDGGTVIRIGGEYYENRGPNVVDVNGSFSWNIGVAAYNSVAESNDADFFIDGSMWLHSCSGAIFVEQYAESVMYSYDTAGTDSTPYAPSAGASIPTSFGGSLMIPGPLRADLTVTAGTSYPNLTVTAPLGPGFQAIPEWTGGAAVDLSTLVPTANTRTGPLGVAVWNPGLDAAEIVRADKVLGA